MGEKGKKRESVGKMNEGKNTVLAKGEEAKRKEAQETNKSRGAYL
jgi:hypothetical protein